MPQNKTAVLCFKPLEDLLFFLETAVVNDNDMGKSSFAELPDIGRQIQIRVKRRNQNGYCQSASLPVSVDPLFFSQCNYICMFTLLSMALGKETHHTRPTLSQIVRGCSCNFLAALSRQNSGPHTKKGAAFCHSSLSCAPVLLSQLQTNRFPVLHRLQNANWSLYGFSFKI